ncbi:hypothetical protein H663_002610 [Limnohabitans planktonicus II-D5]|uniref:Uncharacterized protein n=2 Tax=Limnohabitans planktonicus TaxID=540060 RepID=A0A2T7UI36_9BURK|nr:hypothetical protein H663_002610 [Limnohabitans planktonicus II-D5]
MGSTPAGPTKFKSTLYFGTKCFFHGFFTDGRIPRKPIGKRHDMSAESNIQNELKKMVLCEPCTGIQRNWRRAPGHAELVQGSNRKESRETGQVTITRYRCDRCGTSWEYENNKADQHAGWSVVGG